MNGEVIAKPCEGCIRTGYRPWDFFLCSLSLLKEIGVLRPTDFSAFFLFCLQLPQLYLLLDNARANVKRVIQLMNLYLSVQWCNEIAA